MKKKIAERSRWAAVCLIRDNENTSVKFTDGTRRYRIASKANAVKKILESSDGADVYTEDGKLFVYCPRDRR